MAKIYYAPETGSVSLSPTQNHIYYDAHTNPQTGLDLYMSPLKFVVKNERLCLADGTPIEVNPPCEDCQTLLAIGDPAASLADVRKALVLIQNKLLPV